MCRRDGRRGGSPACDGLAGIAAFGRTASACEDAGGTTAGADDEAGAMEKGGGDAGACAAGGGGGVSGTDVCGSVAGCGVDGNVSLGTMGALPC
ncbi:MULTISPECIES: hypothetical protein [unclassified Rhizobium]|uniref:hypothetical protein n=1 Tax=unclassified Rhizobium TaxID=2613769 RepID=UPI001FDA0745|nr:MULTISPECIES: hypothetical protein [unclassified Rhizobium]